MDVHQRSPAFIRRHAVLLGIILALTAGVMLFDSNWLRGPLVNYLEKKSGRHIRIDDMHLSIAWPFLPTLRLRGVNIENASWASRQPMAVAGEVAFTFQMTSFWAEHTIVTHMSLADADISMERKADGRRNWRLTEPNDLGPGKIRVLTLDAQRSKIHFINEGIDFEIVAQTTPIDVNAKPSPVDEVLVNNLNVDGTYQGVRFNGSALIGNFMSFRESREWFPLRGHLSAGKTRLDIDGRLADIFDLGPVDAQMRLAGDSFAHLHPFLKFKPPVSRRYALEAKVWQDDGKYSFTELKGKVGGADIAGEATYDRKSARPVTTAALHSNSANLLDLVFLAGMDYRTLDSASNQGSAGKGNAQIFSDRVLNLEPMRKFDAHIKLDVKKLRVAKMPIDSLQLNANLVDGALQVSPLDLGAAGGHLVGSFDFNANEQPPVVSTRLDGRNLRLERIVSPGRSETTSEGGVRAQLRASGRGKSLAAIAGSATGTLAALVDGGNISNLVDAKLALNLGKVIGLRIRGDRPIPLHCGAAAFDFRDGIGKSQALLLETEQTHTDGAGTIDLRAQSYELLLTPQPKKPGIFTLNSSIRVSGAFKNADVKIEERVPLRQNGRTAPPATVASLFKPLLDKRRDSACAQMLAPVKTVASAG